MIGETVLKALGRKVKKKTAVAVARKVKGARRKK
jgi:hypothetical protein